MKKILTLVIDGLGYTEEKKGNPLNDIEMKNLQGIINKYPHCLLDASGKDVGLTDGQVGNEIVGYKTLAAGKVLKQRSSYIHDFTDEDNLAINTEIKSTIEHVKKNNSTIHIVGLMSDGGIISSIDETIRLINFLKKQEVKMVVDFIADGKDVEPKSILKYIEMIEETGVPIVTVCGRYYALDNENKWDRTKIYYDLIREGKGLNVKELRLALKNCYIRNITDEYLPPIIVEPDKNIKDNDAVIWINFNSMGANQILTALTNPKLITSFDTKSLINVKFLMFYPINSNINATVLINEEEDISNNLGLYLSKLGITQARIASQRSFKYVTYYFNGELDKKLIRCNNYQVETPEVDENQRVQYETVAVSKQIIKSMEKDTDFILASIDAADVVGHRGNYEEAKKTLTVIDECLGKIIDCAELNFYTIVILSTHGNIESMYDSENKPVTKHTNNKVPFIITNPKIKLEDGTLADVAPTLLSYMDISIPDTMKNSKILFKE